MRRLANALTPVALFALAFAVRSLSWGNVVRDEHVYLHGHDSFYHMRRILYALANQHAALDFDPRMARDFLQDERASIERGEGSNLYDITAWDLGRQAGLDVWWTTADAADMPRTFVEGF